MVGWFAIATSVFSLAPSMAPGAVSLIGLVLSIGALMLSLLSIRDGNDLQYRVTLVIVVLGILLLNDALRLWDPIPMPISTRIMLYGMVSVVILPILWKAKRIAGRGRQRQY